MRVQDPILTRPHPESLTENAVSIFELFLTP
jgi:hypothetical protein